MGQYKALADIPPSLIIGVLALGHSDLLMPNVVEDSRELGAKQGLSYPNVRPKSNTVAVS